MVGAGPGDADLLTIKAVRALQSADVILYDDLISDGVLELARREAKRVMVGKRGGRPSCKQDDINDLMVRMAGQGKHVVRDLWRHKDLGTFDGDYEAVVPRHGVAFVRVRKAE